MIRAFISLTLMGLLGCVLLAANKPVTVTLKDGMGKEVGTAKISDGSGGKGVKIALDLKNLPPGEHAILLQRVPGGVVVDLRRERLRACDVGVDGEGAKRHEANVRGGGGNGKTTGWKTTGWKPAAGTARSPPSRTAPPFRMRHPTLMSF